jgi:hypothetical protein
VLFAQEVSVARILGSIISSFEIRCAIRQTAANSTILPVTEASVVGEVLALSVGVVSPRALFVSDAQDGLRCSRRDSMTQGVAAKGHRCYGRITGTS